MTSRRVVLIVGVILVVLGAVSLWLGGIPYGRERTTMEMGPVEMTAETRNELDVPPLLAGLILAAGVGMVVWGGRRRG